MSSQGDDTFAVYDRQGKNAPVGSFRNLCSTSPKAAAKITGAHLVPLVRAGAMFENGVLVVRQGQAA